MRNKVRSKCVVVLVLFLLGACGSSADLTDEPWSAVPDGFPEVDPNSSNPVSQDAFEAWPNIVTHMRPNEVRERSEWVCSFMASASFEEQRRFGQVVTDEFEATIPMAAWPLDPSSGVAGSFDFSAWLTFHDWLVDRTCPGLRK